MKMENNKLMWMLDCLCMTLVLVGALNWGLVGFFHFNLVAFLFGDMSLVANIVYDLVGLAALRVAYRCFTKCRKCKECE